MVLNLINRLIFTHIFYWTQEVGEDNCYLLFIWTLFFVICNLNFYINAFPPCPIIFMGHVKN